MNRSGQGLCKSKSVSPRTRIVIDVTRAPNYVPWRTSRIHVAALLALLGWPVHAQTVSAVASGQWDTASTWSNGAPPSAGNNYVIGSGFVINSPPVPSAGTYNYAFAGGSLTVESGGTLEFASNNVSTGATARITIPNLVLDNGSSLYLKTKAGTTVYALQMGLSLPSSGTVTIYNNNAGGYGVGLTLAATAVLSGGANINLNLNAAGYSGLTEKNMYVSSANNPFSGNWTVTSANIVAGSRQGGLIAGAVNALGTGQVTLSSSVLVNQVAGGLDSISGVNVGANSSVQVNANWSDPNAFLALNISTSKVAINNSNTAVSIGQLSGVSGSSITGNAAGNSLGVTNTVDSMYAGTIAGSLSLAKNGAGMLTLTGTNTYNGGTQISAGTLQLGNGGTTGSIVGNVTDNGVLAFNHSDDIVYSNIISGAGGLNQLGPDMLTLDGEQTYTGPTQVLAGTLAVDGSIQSNTVTVYGGAILSGFGNIGADVYNRGTVWPGNAIVGDTRYGTLTIRGHYVGQGGVLELNTYLGGDNSPTDLLVIDGGSATGTTGVIVNNTAMSSAETNGNGILIVSAVNDATTTATAFNLASEVRVGALDYRLFRGSIEGTHPNSWYLRNGFIVPPQPPEPPEPPVPPEPPQPPEPPLPPDPPPEPDLPPGVYPIIGPEVATYGVVQPVARELGVMTLGTMDQRIGDSALMASSVVDTDHGPSVWGRSFASNIDNSYRSFAAPQANGNLYGFQTGADVWQGEWIEGHTDRFGSYVSYGQADINVRGLVTNAEATNYAMQHTGALTLRATSFGTYWTHYGPGAWYLDGVVQASTYSGAATTNNARMNTHGVGFAGSLEFGYPIALPQLGAGFVLEPQVQTIWQHTAFSSGNDGLGDVELGSTNGSTGRIGLRGKWHLTSSSGLWWEPYGGIHVWRDWGGRSATVFGDTPGSTSAAQLVPQASRAEVAGGVTGKLLARLSVYGSLGYEHELGSSTNARREGFNASAGLRYTW
ncbi:MAG TPA: autotransporter outer membrane beta-barrel domain-containing protein [Dyella sp.]|nr:autotransporter outer membrane beta-barrel domain-containing protein [Dyella sp.]